MLFSKFINDLSRIFLTRFTVNSHISPHTQYKAPIKKPNLRSRIKAQT